jgi:alcohol dehydrogenase (cytochrome c)
VTANHASTSHILDALCTGLAHYRRPRGSARRSLALLTVAGMALAATSVPVRAQVPAPAAGAEWVRPAGTLQGTRFSALDQINTTNVRRLKEEFDFDTDVVAGHEGAPLVVNNTMYVVSPFPNFLFALDLKNKGKLKWKFNPRADPFAEGKACCDIVNRGAVFATHPSRPNGLVIYTVLDTTVVAVDAKTGATSSAMCGLAKP